jgi:hypothetical protein
MVLKPLKVLQKGLKTLTNHVKTKKEELQAHLAESQPISAEDKQWLDHDANLVDEQQVLEALEKASDYDQGCQDLVLTTYVEAVRDLTMDLSWR